MRTSKERLAFYLTIILGSLGFISSGAGLFLPGIYHDPDWIKKAWMGTDLVSFFLVSPLLVVTLIKVDQGSEKAKLVWMGLTGYYLYNTAFYLFGAAFNKLFLVYTAVFTLSIYVMILGLSTLKLSNLVNRNGAGLTRWISLFLLLCALPLAVVELAQPLKYIFSNKLPNVPSLIFALDLSLVIPNMILAAVLLWRNNYRGYILSAIMLVKGITYGLGLILSSGAVAELSLDRLDPLTPFYVFIFTGSLASLLILLRHTGLRG